MLTRELIGRLPKAELHTHLDAALRPETMIELAARCGIRAADTGPGGSSAASCGWTTRANLEDYLRRFEYTIPLLQSAEAIERVSYEMVEDAARDAPLPRGPLLPLAQPPAGALAWSGRSRRSWPGWRGASGTSGW